MLRDAPQPVQRISRPRPACLSLDLVGKHGDVFVRSAEPPEERAGTAARVTLSSTVGATRRLVLTTANAEIVRAELERLPGFAVIPRYELSRDKDDERSLISGLDGAWATVAGSEPYTEAVFDASPNLRAILRWGTGSDAIDIDAATSAGVAVVTTPGVNAEAVADMALALMLACIRRLHRLDAAVRDASWRTEPATGDLAGATVGIVGLGAIGRAVARRLSGFGCRITALEPNPDPAVVAQHQIELVRDLETMLPRLDALTLHIPLTEDSKHLIGAGELALLPRHAVIVNTARGELIDQAALIEALHSGQIAAAGLDVFEHEPDVHPDLLACPNAVLIPHLGSATVSTRLAMANLAADNLLAALDGKPPPTPLNPEAQPRSPRPAAAPDTS